MQPHYGVRTERHKLVYYDKLKEWELYDLEQDRHETNNVYAQPASAGTVTKLKAELARLRTQYDDRDQFTEELSNGDQFQPVPQQLVFRPDFAHVQDGTAADLSSQGHRLKVAPDSVRDGRKGRSIIINGAGLTLAGASPDPSGKPFTAGAWIRADQLDGVILAQGGGSQGFSLYLKAGVPHFAIRSGGKLAVARALRPVAIGQWVHVAGLLQSRGEATLWINGVPAGSEKSGAIAAKPYDGLSVGADTGNAVVSAEAAKPFHGQLEDVRLYWGALDKETLENWMNGK